MKELVVISGKGGTGKTSITASLATLAKKDAIIADCDVDAADMHLLLEPDFEKSEDFYSGVLAYIDQDLCSKCGRCYEVCRFGAIDFTDGIYSVDELSCEGCGYCARVCESDAIEMNERNVGKWYISNIKTGSKMVHAKLGIGAENSGKLVAKVKTEAKTIAINEKIKYVIVDGSPGVGCPVVSSLSGANFVLLVTEPSVSGLHDLKRVYELVKRFGLSAGCIINKADLNSDKSDEIEKFCKDEGIEFFGKIPYFEDFTKAMVEKKSIVEYSDSKASKAIKECWSKIEEILSKKKFNDR